MILSILAVVLSAGLAVFHNWRTTKQAVSVQFILGCVYTLSCFVLFHQLVPN
jgi:hypothetical protein